MNRSPVFSPRVGYVSFQVGMGAVSTAILWLWLKQPGGEARIHSLLLPFLFGFALPGLLGWISLSVASPFFTTPFMRRLVGFVPAVASISLLLGRRLAEVGVLYDNDLVLVTGLAAVVSLASILFSSLEMGNRSQTFNKRGMVAVLGLIAGAILTSVGGASAGLVMGSITMVIAGLSFGFSTSASARGPWIRAERSIGRFARLIDLLRTEPDARRWLWLYACLFALTLSSLAWLPALWPIFGRSLLSSSLDIINVGIMVIGFLLGIGIGGWSDFSRTEKCWRREKMATIQTLGAAGALALLALQPAQAGSVAVLVGIPLGLVGRLCRESLLKVLDRKGARLPGECEAIIGTTLCLFLLIVGGLLAMGEWMRVSPQPPILVFVSGFCLLSFFCWQLGKKRVETEAESHTEQPLPWSAPDSYLPGIAPAWESPPINDGRAVTILYEIPEENLSDFHDAMADLARLRRRLGALQWRLSRHLEVPTHLTESYLLESWSDYQEAIRHETAADRAIKQRVFDLNDWDSLPAESHQALEEI